MAEARKSSKHTQTPGAVARDQLATGTSDDREELVFTLSKATHDVLEVAHVTSTGQRVPLSEQECADLAGQDVVDETVRWAHAAFEAGLVEGLGVGDEQDDFDDDALLSSLLLNRSAESGVLRMGMRGAAVRRLLLRRLLRSRLTRVPTAEQRRKPIGHECRNGSSSSH